MDANRNINAPFGIGAIVIAYLRDHNLEEAAKWFAIRYGFPLEIVEKDNALREAVIKWLYKGGKRAPATVLAKKFNLEHVLTNLLTEEGQIVGLGGQIVGLGGQGLL